jgi:biopolymer transport protein ExbD
MFARKSTRKEPEIPTAALPDIIFILLFFFVITSQPKPNQDLVDATIPTAERAQKANAKFVVNLAIGKPFQGSGQEYAIQFENKIVSLDQIVKEVDDFRQNKMDASSKGKQITAYISGDYKGRVGLIRDIEDRLRTAGVYTIINKTQPD